MASGEALIAGDHDIAAVLRLAANVNSPEQLREVLLEACRAVVELLGADHSGIVAFSSNGSGGKVVAEFPRSVAADGIVIQVRGIPAEAALLRGVGFKYDDVSRAKDLGPVRDVLIRLGIQSILVEPVHCGERVVASFSVDWMKTRHEFSRKEEDVCQAFALMLGIAYGKVAQLEAERQRAERSDRLRETIRELNSDLRPEVVLRKALARTATLLGCRNAGFHVYDPNRKELRLAGAHCHAETLVDQILREGEGMAGRLLLPGAPSFLRTADYQTSEYVAPALRTGHPFGAVLVARIPGQDVALGTLFADDVSGRHYTDEDAWLLCALADQVGVTLRNAYQVTRKENSLQLLLMATRLVAEADSAAGLSQLAELIVSLMKTSFCRVILTDKEGEFLRPVAAACVKRASEPLSWIPRLGVDVEISSQPAMSEVAARRHLKHLRWADERARPVLQNLSEQLKLPTTPQSVLWAPLVARGRFIGLLEVGELRSETRAPLAAEQRKLIRAVARQIGALVERVSRAESERIRTRRISELYDQARYLIPELEVGTLLNEILLLAARVFGCRQGHLFVPNITYGRLELHASVGVVHENLTLPIEDEFAGKAARTGTPELLRQASQWPVAPSLFDGTPRTLAAAPIKVGANVEAVLVLPDLEIPNNPALSLDLEIVDLLVQRCSSTLATAYTISPKARTEKLLRLLQPILLYLSRCHEFRRITRAFLSGLTAAYGLRFNRAVLLMLDHNGHGLEGRDAIGELTYADAERAWNSFDRDFDDFGKLASRLESGAPPPSSTLGETVETIRIPLGDSGALAAVLERKLPLLIEPVQAGDLPQALADWFQPETEVLVLPMVVGGESVGLVVADNKFTRSRITDLDVNVAMDFVLGASPSLQNTLLFSVTTQAAKWAERTHALAHLLMHADTPEEAAEGLMQIVGAQGISLVLCNAAGEVNELYAAGNACKDAVPTLSRVSVQVIAAGRPWWTSDAQNQPEMNREMLLPDDRAMVCLPMWDHGQMIGVAWLSFANPRKFEPAEIEHFQECVGSAAAVCSTASNRKAANQLVAATQQAAGRADLRDLTTAMVQYARASFAAGSATYWPWDAENNRFLPQLLVSDGIPEEDLELFRSNEPRPGHITFRALELGYCPIPDIEAEPLVANSAERLKHAGIRSFQAVALESGEEKFGVLYVSYRYKRSFGRDDRSALAGFAAYASWLIANTRQSRRAGTAQRLAQKTAREFAVGGDCESILLSICGHAVEMFECTNAVLFRSDQSSHTLIMPPTTGGSLQNGEYLRHCGKQEPDDWLMQLLESEGPVIQEEVDKHPFYRDKRFARDEGIKTFIAVPLWALSRPVGLLFINFRRSHRVTEQEKQDIQLLADFAATAVHNAQHYVDLAHFSTALLGSASVTEVFKVAVRETAHLMGTPLSNILLKLPDEGLRAADAYGWGDALDRFCVAPGYLSHPAYTMQKGEPVWVDDFGTETRFQVPDVVRENKIKSGLSALLKRNGEPVGVILVHTRTPRKFRELDAYLLESLGNQISQACERARHFEAVEAHRANILALNESSRAIIRSISDLDAEKVYSAILEQAVRSVNGKADLATLLLYDAEKEVLSLAAVHPPELEEELRSRIGLGWSIRTGHPRTGTIGVVGQAILKREPQLVNDVLADTTQAYYLEVSGKTRSNLAIPLLNEADAPVGVLNVESDTVGAFDCRDKEVLQGLALIMVIVLQVGRKHEEVIKARSEARAHLILAWLGFAANHGWHSSRGHLATIRGAALNIRQELTGRLGSAVPSQVLENLQLVEILCKEMLCLDLAPPLDSHEARGSVSVNEFLREFLYEVENRADRCFRIETELQLSDEVRVSVNVPWFRCAVNILVENAARELARTAKERQVMRLISRPAGSAIEIVVEDFGRGIPTDIQRFLGKDVVPGGWAWASVI